MRARAGHAELLSALRRAAFTDDGALLFVHAGLDPARPLDAQGDTLWWGGGTFDAITRPYAGFRLLVRGYDPTGKGFRVTASTATLDNGCGFGGSLCAGCFDTAGRLVDCLEA